MKDDEDQPVTKKALEDAAFAFLAKLLVHYEIVTDQKEEGEGGAEAKGEGEKKEGQEQEGKEKGKGKESGGAEAVQQAIQSTIVTPELNKKAGEWALAHLEEKFGWVVCERERNNTSAFFFVNTFIE